MRGPFPCAKHALPHLVRRGGGVIINVSSHGAFQASPTGIADYAVAKGGLVTLTYHLASEYGADNVRAIAPGPVPMDLNRPFLGTPEGRAMTASFIPLGRLGEIDDVARAAVFLASGGGAAGGRRHRGAMRRAATTVLLALLAGCSTKSVGRPPCMNHVLHESVAPGGNEKAVIFERDCMTGATIQVSLVPTDARAPSEPGNVFAVGAGKHALQGRTVVAVAWSGPAKLTISYTKGAAVMRSEGRVGHVEVGYAFLDDAAEAPAAQPSPQARRAR